MLPMLSINNIYKTIRKTYQLNDSKNNKETILAHIKACVGGHNIKSNNFYYQHKFNNFILKGKPDGLIDDSGIIITKQNNNIDLSTIPFYEYIKAQAMMLISKKKKCLYSTHYNGTVFSQFIIQNQTIQEFILHELDNFFNKITHKPSYKILLSKVLPLYENDNLSYYLEQSNVEKDKTFTQEWQKERYLKAKYKLFNLLKNFSFDTVPVSFIYEKCLENMTLEYLRNDKKVIFNPHISNDKYFFQPFAVINDTNGYKLVFPVYSLPKYTNIKYEVQTNFFYQYCIKHNIKCSQTYLICDINDNFKIISVNSNNISVHEPNIPINTYLDKFSIINYKMFPFLNKDNGYKRKHIELAEKIQDVSLLTNIGPKYREKLHKMDIYTLTDLYTAMENGNIVLPLLSERFLKVNNQNVVPILPLSLDKNLETYNHESFVDMEFAYDKSLEYTCIYNIGILQVIDGNNKFIQLTINSLDIQGEYDLLDKFFKIVDKNTVMIHWNHTERTMLKQAIERHNYPNGWELPKSIDFYKVMKENAIAVKGCYKLKLKCVANAMKKNGLIEHSYEEIINGTDLSTRIIQMYETNSYNRDDPFIKRVEEYNKNDIYTMYSIVEYIRKYYTY